MKIFKTKPRFSIEGILTEGDFRRVDLFNPNRTAATIDTSKIPGIVCDNFDLPGKAMYSNTGLMASVLLKSDRAKFDTNWNQYNRFIRAISTSLPNAIELLSTNGPHAGVLIRIL